VIGLASEPNHAWLKAHGVVPVAYGPGTAERVREACGGNVDAFRELEQGHTHGKIVLRP
jgi:hypothetical protein